MAYFRPGTKVMIDGETTPNVYIVGSAIGFGDYEISTLTDSSLKWRVPACYLIEVFERDKQVTKVVDWSKPIQTRDGCKAVLLEITKHPKHTNGDVYTVSVKGAAGNWYQHGVHITGLCDAKDGTCSQDIINAPEEKTKTFWVNIYSDFFGNSACSREQADHKVCNDREACVEVTVKYKVGDGLET